MLEGAGVQVPSSLVPESIGLGRAVCILVLSVSDQHLAPEVCYSSKLAACAGWVAAEGQNEWLEVCLVANMLDCAVRGGFGNDSVGTTRQVECTLRGKDKKLELTKHAMPCLLRKVAAGCRHVAQVYMNYSTDINTCRRAPKAANALTLKKTLRMLNPEGTKNKLDVSILNNILND